MTKPRKADAAAGLPSWVRIVVALVPVGGLLWAVVQHFDPKVEPAKPAAAAVAPAPSVSVNGSGNVGVGVMNGGTITNSGGTKP